MIWTYSVTDTRVDELSRNADPSLLVNFGSTRGCLSPSLQRYVARSWKGQTWAAVCQNTTEVCGQVFALAGAIQPSSYTNDY
eukprot:SAG31_NODE_5061_length_2765_cov_3.097899_1_plen_82_part_00